MSGSEPRIAVAYARVSSVKQRTKGDGLESQLTRVREFARVKGYTVVETFKDDVSGKLFDRPGMQAMLAYVRKHRVLRPVILLDDLSRLARDVKTHIELRAAIAKAGGTLESPSIEFGTDSDSLLVEHLLAAVSQHQRQKNGEQVRNRMRARMLNGYFVFHAPQGFKYKAVSGRGKMLVRDEPVASIIQDALEKFSLGELDTQSDVVRYLEAQPLYPKQKGGRVHRSRVALLLTQPVYGGYIEAPSDWDVPLRPGQHEGLVSWATFKRIQDRLNGVGHVTSRKNVNADFPLRSHVLCDDCSAPLTACWSKSRNGAHHPYYLCQSRDCVSRGKSIRRDKLEGEFIDILKSAQPTEKLFRVAFGMFEKLWNRKAERAAAEESAMSSELAKIEKQIETLLTRIVDASVPSVIGAYEERVRKLEESKFLVLERMASGASPATSFRDTLRTALAFLASPWKVWETGPLEVRRIVLRLMFSERLRYSRTEGYRTANLSLPFNLLGGVSGAKSALVGPVGLEPTTRPL
ncbi:recombinase family protein [Phenylobacterium sp.]|uniref:recombinase family protein n=1 Tax=Phenylobacterium sp. TaxID=1871053 RepID=UPI0035B27A3E